MDSRRHRHSILSLQTTLFARKSHDIRQSRFDLSRRSASVDRRAVATRFPRTCRNGAYVMVTVPPDRICLCATVDDRGRPFPHSRDTLVAKHTPKFSTKNH